MMDLEKRVLEAAVEYHSAVLAVEMMPVMRADEKADDFYRRKGPIYQRERHARLALSIATTALKAERLKRGPAQ